MLIFAETFRHLPKPKLSAESRNKALSVDHYSEVSQPHCILLLSFPCSHSTHLLAATTLRNVLGTKHLAEILSERETISHVMEQTLDEATDPWGVKVERVEM